MKAINNKIVRAHKPHHCDFCGCNIEKGALYNLQFIKMAARCGQTGNILSVLS